jgi:hypothetical protein
LSVSSTGIHSFNLQKLIAETRENGTKIEILSKRPEKGTIQVKLQQKLYFKSSLKEAKKEHK